VYIPQKWGSGILLGSSRNGPYSSRNHTHNGKNQSHSGSKILTGTKNKKPFKEVKSAWDNGSRGVGKWFPGRRKMLPGP
jgi:hypothetical protein